MTNREKEKREDKRITHPTKESSSPIARLINKTLNEKHKVLLTTDLHLWVKTKDKNSTIKRKNFKEVVDNICKVDKDDLVIILGDLVDGEFKNQNELKEVMLSIPCENKVLVRGNNDIFTDSFYESCGFKYVVYAFTWNNVLFTHAPVENDAFMNIHGHIHGCKDYWIPYTNQIDVFNEDRKYSELFSIIKRQGTYSKTIKDSSAKMSNYEAVCEQYDLLGFLKKQPYCPAQLTEFTDEEMQEYISKCKEYIER